MPEQELSMGVAAQAEDKRVAREEPEEDECYVRRQAEDRGKRAETCLASILAVVALLAIPPRSNCAWHKQKQSMRKGEELRKWRIGG